MPQSPNRASAWVITLLAAIAVMLTFLVDELDGKPAPPAATPAPTVQLGGPGRASIPKPTIPALRSAVDGVADHRNQRDELPAGLSLTVAAKRQAGLEDLARHDQLPLVSPDAAPQIPGCTSRFVRNFSSRGGVAPRELVAHYTVSRNVPGWSDVWAIVSLFDRAAFAASSHFVIDAEGNCAYIVRDTDKAWTQAAANPFSVSIEFIAMGDEGRLSAAALAKGGQLWAYEAKKWRIPLRLGAVRDCLPTTPGLVDHAMLGACGGGHHDLRPLFGTHLPPRSSEDAIALGPLLDAARAAAGPVATIASLTAGERQAAEQLLAQRRVARRHGGWAKVAPVHLTLAIAAKNALRRADTRIKAAAAKSGWDRLRRRQRHAYIAQLLG